MPCSRLLQVLMLLAVNPAIPAAGAACLDDVQRCARLTDDRARLDCYDEIVRQLAGANAQSLAAASAAATGTATTAKPGSSSDHITAPSPVKPGADFGLSEAAKQAQDPEKAKPDRISAQVATVAQRLTGEMIVTLANGQVWGQLEPDTRARLKAGDTVTIRRAALGSYLLVTPSGMATRVKRLK